MPERLPSRGLSLAAAVCLAAAACAPLPAPSTAPRPAAPLSVAEVEAFAELLQVEDRRSADLERVGAHARHPSPRVRARAALALGRLRRTEGMPLLRALLGDPDSAVVATAAFAVGQVADSTAAPLLMPLLRVAAAELRPTVAAEAAYALGKLRGSGAGDSLVAFLARVPVDRPALAPAAGSALLAAGRLPRPRDPGAITRWLAAPDPELRWRAAYPLARRLSPASVTALRPHLDDPDPRLRSLAVRAMTAPLADSVGAPRAELLAALVRAAGDGDYAVRINALRTLGTYADPAAVEALRRTVASGGPHERVAAVESLGRLARDAGAATGDLRALATGPGEPVALRAAAMDALVTVDGTAAAGVAGALAAAPQWRLRAAVGRALGALPRQAEGFRALLADPDPRVASAALQARIDASGDTVGVHRELLLEQLGAADVMVRAAALGALARVADPSTLPAILDAYESAQRDTLNDAALAAVDAIAAMRASGAAPERAFFARFPRSADYLVRLRAAERFGSAAAPWGEPLPLETRRSREDYLGIVRRWVAPGLRGDPPEAHIHTSAGVVHVEFDPVGAPLTTESFLSLAAQGYFDGQEWPRVVPNFVVQGGDPRGDTSGGPGYVIRDEIGRERYGTGSLGMALSGPDTGGSQFFLTHSPQPHLDGTYAIFGREVDGREVLQRLLPGDVIIRIERTR